MKRFHPWIPMWAGLGVVAVSASPPLSIAPVPPGQIGLSWEAAELRPYQIEGCSNLTGDWHDVGAAVIGQGAIHTEVMDLDGPQHFYRLREGAMRPGFDGLSLSANDDLSYPEADSGMPEVPLGFDVNFYGETVSGCYVNNNGNITFGSGLKSFTPEAFGNQGDQIIAPFWADVDTRGLGSDVVRFSAGGETVDGRAAFGVTFRSVGYFDQRSDKLNSFQVILIDRSDIAAGDFDIEFNYDRIVWETGGASGGMDGYGGASARVGVANGDGLYFEYQGSGQSLAFLDADPDTGEINHATGLIYQSAGSAMPGRIVLPVRNGIVEGSFEVDAGVDQVLDENSGARFQLAGTADEGVDVVWRQISGPEPAVFSDPTSLTPTVTIPTPGSWNFELTGVKQGAFEVIATSEVRVTHPADFRVSGGGNRYPESEGPVSVTFDGAEAWFSGGEPVTVVWEQVEGDEAVITDPLVLQAEVTLPGPGNYRFRITGTTTHSPVSDQFQASSEVDVSVMEPLPPAGE